MKERILKNPAASIRTRLYNLAQKNGEDFQRILTRYAIERLLFRLSQAEAADQYVLKGAMLFVTWPEHIFRPTGDLDLLGRGDPDPVAITELFTHLCRVEMPKDGIVFDPTTLKVEPVREVDEYQGVQLRVKGELAKAIAHVQVDIGFGDHVYPPPRRQNFPCILADMPVPSILMYPQETVVAEKFEAMIRFGETNGRIKDFYDLWVMTRTFTFELPILVGAVGGTFRRRGTPFPVGMPIGLTAAFAAIAHERGLWTGFLRRTPLELKPPMFPDIQAKLWRFFDPVILALAAPEGTRGRWDPDGSAWH